jgi:HD-GYP domain-containing protein (c-di-GMP phosphodiesterase class II)
MQAKKEVVDNAGTHFDPAVVKAFDEIFSQIDSEIPLLPKQLQS